MKKIFLILFILFIAVGCGTNMFEGLEDKNTGEATDLEVSLKLDSGDYQWILNNPDKANATDYSAAAMGAAGLDPTELIKALNDIAEETQTAQNDLGAVTSIPIDPTYLDELQKAKDKLQQELVDNPANPDLSFQMVLTSLTSTITALAQVGQNVSNFDATDGIDSGEAVDLGGYISSNPTVQVDTNGDGNDDTNLSSLVAEDVVNMVVALPDSELGGSELEDVLTETTQGSESLNYDGSGDVTSGDISDYLTNVLGQ